MLEKEDSDDRSLSYQVWRPVSGAPFPSGDWNRLMTACLALCYIVRLACISEHAMSSSERLEEMHAAGNTSSESLEEEHANMQAPRLHDVNSVV